MTNKEQEVIGAIERNFNHNGAAVRESLVKAKKGIESALKELRKRRPLITTANVNFAMYDICKAQCLLTGVAVQSKVLGAAEKAAKEREQYQICHVITRLLMDSYLLRESDERNGKPYKLFGEPLTIAYGRLACQVYRAADIDRKFWLAYLKETVSDPKGMDKHLRRIFRDRRCQ